MFERNVMTFMSNEFQRSRYPREADVHQTNKFAVFAVIEFLPALSLTVLYCLGNLRNIYACILSNLMTDCNPFRMFSIDLRPVNKYIVLLIIWLNTCI